MKSIALIHTVKGVANTFEDTLKKGLSQEVGYNLFDDSWQRILMKSENLQLKTATVL